MCNESPEPSLRDDAIHVVTHSPAHITGFLRIRQKSSVILKYTNNCKQDGHVKLVRNVDYSDRALIGQMVDSLHAVNTSITVDLLPT